MNRITLTVALALATLSTAAVAQTAQEQQACMNDAFRVCSSTIPDRNRTIACMVQHKAELSPACQTVMAKYAPTADGQRRIRAGVKANLDARHVMMNGLCREVLRARVTLGRLFLQKPAPWGIGMEA